MTEERIVNYLKHELSTRRKLFDEQKSGPFHEGFYDTYHKGFLEGQVFLLEWLLIHCRDATDD